MPTHIQVLAAILVKDCAILACNHPRPQVSPHTLKERKGPPTDAPPLHDTVKEYTMKDLPTLSSTKVPTKPELYAHLSLQLSSLIDGQRSWVTNLSNASALIYHALRDRQSALGSPTPTINWVGFYLRSEFLGASITTGKGKLLLAPFQGRIACTEIPFGKGVCGAAAREGTVQLVPDVHAFPGHIACDSATNSEVVVPLLSSDGTVLGVFDLDCEEHNGFDADDVAGLTAIAKLLVDGCDWPSCST